MGSKDEFVADLLVALRQVFVGVLGRNISDMIVSGSAARGEAVVVETQTGWLMLSDVEVFVVVKHRPKTELTRRLARRVAEFENSLGVGAAGFHVDYSILMSPQLHRHCRTFQHYETAMTGLVLMGDNVFSAAGGCCNVGPTASAALAIEKLWPALMFAVSGAPDAERLTMLALLYKVGTDVVLGTLLDRGEVVATYRLREERFLQLLRQGDCHTRWARDHEEFVVDAHRFRLRPELFSRAVVRDVARRALLCLADYVLAGIGWSDLRAEGLTLSDKIEAVARDRAAVAPASSSIRTFALDVRTALNTTRLGLARNPYDLGSWVGRNHRADSIALLMRLADAWLSGTDLDEYSAKCVAEHRVLHPFDLSISNAESLAGLCAQHLAYLFLHQPYYRRKAPYYLRQLRAEHVEEVDRICRRLPV